MLEVGIDNCYILYICQDVIVLQLILFSESDIIKRFRDDTIVDKSKSKIWHLTQGAHLQLYQHTRLSWLSSGQN